MAFKSVFPKVKPHTFSKTMLVIGAGAHRPYEFPIATKLTGEIIGLCNKNLKIGSLQPIIGDEDRTEFKKQICRYIQNFGLLGDTKSQNASDIGRKLDNFLKSFARTGVPSIDTFLSQLGKKELPPHEAYYPAVGKLLIACFIRDYERMKGIGFRGSDWIQYITSTFLLDDEACTEFFVRPPKIYTFNYDTFFERCLIEFLVNFHRKTREEAVTMVKGLGIKHIYGSIQSLEQDEDSHENNEILIIKMSLDDIKVIGQERDSGLTSLSLEIARAFAESENVYFLGYGFDKLNNQLLFEQYRQQLMNFGGETNFYSTNVGLTRHKLMLINSDLQHYGLSGIPINFGNTGQTCMQLIEENEPIFSTT